MATEVIDETFAEKVIEKSKVIPVIVDLWAPWCEPCKALTPIIEAAVNATEGKVELATVNIDENPQVRQTFQVQSIPAVYAFKDGAIVDGFMGAQGEHAYHGMAYPMAYPWDIAYDHVPGRPIDLMNMINR